MSDVIFKKLTYLLLWMSIFPSTTFALPLVEGKNYPTHYRITIKTNSSEIAINKADKAVNITTLNYELFKELRSGLEALAQNNPYFHEIAATDKNYPQGSLEIKVDLLNKKIDVFSFYNENSNQYILDFWIDPAKIPAKKVTKVKQKSVQLGQMTQKLLPETQQSLKLTNDSKKQIPTLIVTADRKIASIPENENTHEKLDLKNATHEEASKPQEEVLSAYRDFRYGAAFFWNYPSFRPQMVRLVNLQRKTPEYLYPIKNREVGKNEIEDHMQLNINLYRKGKYGLMAKSIEIFHQKYGEEMELDSIEYLEANALLKNNFENSNKGPKKMAINMYSNLMERTQNYEFKVALLKYLIQNALEEGDYVKSLQYSKQTFVLTKGHFDEETARFAAQSILYSFANLKQIDQIEHFIDEAEIKKLLPEQTLMSYVFYVLLEKGDTKKLVNLFESKEKSYQRPIERSILYNVAEAYFREAALPKAVEKFDEFTTYYSFEKYSSYARLRLALCYDLMDKDVNLVRELYKNAIDKVSLADIRYESQIRYVGLELARKRIISDEDREKIVFLENSISDDKDKDNLSANIKKLLWLVRLRTFLNEGNFKMAIRYLQTLPLAGMTPVERRIFEGEGAEIIYGLILDYYEIGNYGQVVKLWEEFETIYLNKVAKDPRLNYLVAKSYLNLNLEKSFMQVQLKLKELPASVEKTFPIWIEAKSIKQVHELSEELELFSLVKNKKWEEAESKCDEIMKKNPAFIKGSFFKGIIAYEKNQYAQAVANLENFILVSENNIKMNHEEIAMLFTDLVESLYQLGKVDKVRTNAHAILNDIQKQKLSSSYILKLRERVTYLLIEMLYGEDSKKNFAIIEKYITEFRVEFPKSNYSMRVYYILGKALTSEGKEEKALEIFNSIINNISAPTYLRELAKTELSTIEITKKSLRSFL